MQNKTLEPASIYPDVRGEQMQMDPADAQPAYYPTRWRFLSENHAYGPVEIEREEMPYPILGTFVGKLEKVVTVNR